MARVLIVDDDPRTLDVLEISLELGGHDPIRATDGQQAVSLARTSRPHAIILDSMMPVMDGLEATRHLRRDPQLSETPIVMVTARSLDGDVWEGWQTGVDSYLTKPLDLVVLQEELARLGVAPEASLAEVA